MNNDLRTSTGQSLLPSPMDNVVDGNDSNGSLTRSDGYVEI